MRSPTSTAAIGVASVLFCAAALLCCANATADPHPGPAGDPAQPQLPAAPPPPVHQMMMGPSSAAALLPGLDALTGLPNLNDAPLHELLLGQTPIPAAPGEAPVILPGLNALNNQYLLPQYVEPVVPGEGQVFGVEPGQENADISTLDYLRRLYATYRAGGFKGALLGQKPREQHGEQLSDPATPPNDSPEHATQLEPPLAPLLPVQP